MTLTVREWLSIHAKIVRLHDKIPDPEIKAYLEAARQGVDRNIAAIEKKRKGLTNA